MRQAVSESLGLFKRWTESGLHMWVSHDKRLMGQLTVCVGVCTFVYAWLCACVSVGGRVSWLHCVLDVCVVASVCVCLCACPCACM